MTACSTSNMVLEPESHFAHSSAETSVENSFTASSNACLARPRPLLYGLLRTLGVILLGGGLLR
jgi:hypothetical protein